MIDFGQLECLSDFVGLACQINCGAPSLNSAAARMFVSKSTLSKHISSLESHLGCTLIVREPRIGLTPAGNALYRAASPLLDDLEAGIDAAYSQALAVGADVQALKIPNYAFLIPGFSACVEKMRSGYARAHQPQTLAIEYQDFDAFENTPLPQIASSGIVDLCLLAFSPSLSEEQVKERLARVGLDSTPYGTVEQVLVMDASNPLADADHLTLSDLDGASFFNYGSGAYQNSLYDAIEESARQQHVNLSFVSPNQIIDRGAFWASIDYGESFTFSSLRYLEYVDFFSQDRLVARRLSDHSFDIRHWVAFPSNSPQWIRDAATLLRDDVS